MKIVSKYRRKNEDTFTIELEPQSEHQAEYIVSIRENVVTVGLGFAGTGKTYIASTLAAQFKNKSKHGRVILCRPNVSDSKSIGALPGDTLEKLSPWVVPYTAVLKEHLGQEKVDADMRKGTIEVVPFEVIQGRTFDDSFVLLDEAQHVSKSEMNTFLKRVGVNCTVVISGDIAQARLGKSSGLAWLLKMRETIPEVRDNVHVVEFNCPEDIVRSEFCRDITVGIDRWEEMNERHTFK
jgi:phosphate starvation-inducible PhoH-like protein